MNEEQTRRELMTLLASYLAGDTGIDEFMDWEADLSLDPVVAGQLRDTLDRLALVAEEVVDGSRNERDFRALAVEAMLRGGPAVTTGVATRTEAIWLRVNNRPVDTINLEFTFAGT